MKNIRIGNDFVFVWVIERDGQAENLNLATDIVLTLSSCYGTKIITDYTIADGNKLRIEFNPTILDKVADYNLKLSYRVADSQFGDGINDCTVDIYCFSIVPRTALADAADEFASTSDIGVAIRGDSAFRVWQLQDGNADKTIEDYFDYLMQPALEAAEIADVATASANYAANTANEAAELANTKANLADQKATLADQKATFANEKAELANAKAGLAETATTNANNAEGLRAIAEQGRVTAEGNRVTAESNRVTVEGNRVTTEQGRVTAENSRVSAESTRGSNENTRISQEAARVAAEAARVASGAELKTNMSTNIETDKASTTKYPQLKALYDWITIKELKSWFIDESYEITGTITYDSKGNINTPVSISWVSGATGTLTITRDSNGNATTWIATHVLAGITKTITQPMVTRDSLGNITNKPAITIA